MIRNRERVVSKDDLLAAVWNGRIVSESTLGTRINAARSAIGDSGEEQRLLRTAYGKGIRFVGAVREQEETVGKLAAIFAADIEGYSQLMGQDEIGTLRRLTACRAILDERIAAYRGRIFGSAGDSVVADFANAVDAVQCAVAVQDAIAKDNAARPAGEQMRFRIGVHVGDVIVQGENLLGDGVNIAARLAALAEPGGICISGTVRDQIGTKLPIALTDLGEQQVKNIAQPIRAYRVRGEAAIGVTATPPPLPDKPSIAVLPFTNMSGDPEQEFFADGIAEDIITALSRYPSLFVIARNSCFTYKGRAVDVKQVGRELGVRYVLEGSLRKSGNRIRVTAQLVEAETGKHVWAERYDRDARRHLRSAGRDHRGGDDRDCPGHCPRRAAAGHAQAAGKPRRLGRLPARALAFGEEYRGRHCARGKILSAGDRSRPQFPRRPHGARLCTAPSIEQTRSARNRKRGVSASCR